MKALRSIESVLNRIEGALLVAFLAIMVLLAFLQVVLRNVFSEGILWADILLRHLVMWLGFLGASMAVSHQRHIGIDALTRLLSEKGQHVSRIVTNLFAAVICYLLMDASWSFLGFEMEDPRPFLFGMPEWYSELILPVGFGLLMIHFLIRVGLLTGELLNARKS